MSVKLNIGGTVFQTSRSTLIKHDCMFRGLLDSGIPLETDESGCVFIDRDPTHFRYILNFLRDGTVKLPDNKGMIEEILKEAEFYSIQKLIDLCENHGGDCRLAKDMVELKKMLIVATRNVLVLTFPVVSNRWEQINYAIFNSLVKKYKIDVILVENKDKSDMWTYELHFTDPSRDSRSNQFYNNNDLNYVLSCELPA